MTVHYFACRGITNTGIQDFAYSAYHINYLYFKDHKFLTINFISTMQMGLRYKGIKQFP